MKNVIYIDVLLLVNFLIACFFLLAAGRLSGLEAGFARLLLGAVLAALSTLILFAPELPPLFQLFYKLATALLCTAAAYGVRAWRRSLAAAVWFAALNMLLAGFALLYIRQTGSQLVQTSNLAVYVRISPLALVAMAALCSLAVGLVQWILAPAQAPPRAAGFSFSLGGSELHVRAVHDSGCALRDPMTCVPVLLISYPDFRSRLPQDYRAFLSAWFDGKNVQPPPGAALRLVPCRTVSGQALLPGFAAADLGLITRRGVRRLGTATVAFSPRAFNAQAYEALYGSDLVPPRGRISPNEEEPLP